MLQINFLCVTQMFFFLNVFVIHIVYEEGVFGNDVAESVPIEYKIVTVCIICTLSCFSRSACFISSNSRQL